MTKLVMVWNCFIDLWANMNISFPFFRFLCTYFCCCFLPYPCPPNKQTTKPKPKVGKNINREKKAESGQGIEWSYKLRYEKLKFLYSSTKALPTIFGKKLNHRSGSSIRFYFRCTNIQKNFGLKNACFL